MELLVYDALRSKNSAYFRREQNGKITPVGFGELINQNVRFSELDGAVVLMHDDEEIPVEECIPFTKETLANHNVIKYLQDRDAISRLFVKIFGVWVQTDVRILQNHIRINK